MDRRFRAPAAVAAMLGLVGLGAWLLAGRATPSLGPVDGFDLPPADTGRVAVGDPAPNFTLVSRSGEPVTLSSFGGEKAVVLVFYRGHW